MFGRPQIHLSSERLWTVRCVEKVDGLTVRSIIEIGRLSRRFNLPPFRVQPPAMTLFEGRRETQDAINRGVEIGIEAGAPEILKPRHTPYNWVCSDRSRFPTGTENPADYRSAAFVQSQNARFEPSCHRYLETKPAIRRQKPFATRAPANRPQKTQTSGSPTGVGNPNFAIDKQSTARLGIWMPVFSSTVSRHRSRRNSRRSSERYPLRSS